MKIDVHIHLAGVGTNDSGCWLAPRFRRRITFRALRRWYGITREQMEKSVDADWAALLARTVRGSTLDRGVALGFDGVYRQDGSWDEARSQLIVPPRWVFSVCRRWRRELLPGPSVNPYRADALERLDECIEGGAVLLKWLPAVQAIDPSDSRILPFYERMRRAGLPLLVHAGGSEQTFEEVTPEFQNLELLRTPLDAGVTVICAHSAAPVIYSRDENQIPLLKDLLEQYPNLWVDNSGMANPSRFYHLAALAKDATVRNRTLYGSDFPVPSSPVYYVPWMGARRALQLQKIANPLLRDIAIKRELGFQDESLSRATSVLPNLDVWRDSEAE